MNSHIELLLLEVNDDYYYKYYILAISQNLS